MQRQEDHLGGRSGAATRRGVSAAVGEEMKPVHGWRVPGPERFEPGRMPAGNRDDSRPKMGNRNRRGNSNLTFVTSRHVVAVAPHEHERGMPVWNLRSSRAPGSRSRLCDSLEKTYPGMTPPLAVGCCDRRRRRFAAPAFVAGRAGRRCRREGFQSHSETVVVGGGWSGCARARCACSAQKIGSSKKIVSVCAVVRSHDRDARSRLGAQDERRDVWNSPVPLNSKRRHPARFASIAGPRVALADDRAVDSAGRTPSTSRA